MAADHNAHALVAQTRGAAVAEEATARVATDLARATPAVEQPAGTLWMPRRDWLARMTWWTVLASLSAMTGASFRMLFPRVTFDPAATFKVGFPHEYAVGEVSERWKKRYRVWIVRTEEGFFALSAKCTHLGCTPNWIETEGKFKCPCHGSGFYSSGVNFEGPAPRPLERFRVALADDGQLLVDRSRSYRQEAGEWDSPDAFLRLT